MAKGQHESVGYHSQSSRRAPRASSSYEGRSARVPRSKAVAALIERVRASYGLWLHDRRKGAPAALP